MIQEKTINDIFKKMLDVDVKEGVDYHRKYETKTMNHIVLVRDNRPGWKERHVKLIGLDTQDKNYHKNYKSIAQGFEGVGLWKFIIDDNKQHMWDRAKKVFGDRWTMAEYEEVVVDGKTWYTISD